MTDPSPSRKPPSTLPPAGLHLLSGALSGLASCLLLQPLDLLKTRLQQGQDHSSNKPRPSILSTTKEVVAKDGVLGLWRGTAPTVARNVPGVAMYFLTLTELRTLMTRSPLFSTAPPLPPTSTSKAKAPDVRLATALPKLTPTGNLIAGAAARTSVGFVLMPVTVLKARFESSLYHYTSMSSALSSIRAEGGYPALWRGFIPTAMRDAPYAGLFVVSYELSKDLLTALSLPSAGRQGVEEKSVLAPSAIHAISGSVGAVFATLITTPFDFLKTRQQLQPALYSTMRSTMRKVWREKGVRGFFDGAGLRVVRKGASSAVGWTIYEGLIRRWAK